MPTSISQAHYRHTASHLINGRQGFEFIEEDFISSEYFEIKK